MHFWVCRLCVASIRAKASILCAYLQLLQGILWGITATVKKPCFCAVNYMADIEQRPNREGLNHMQAYEDTFSRTWFSFDYLLPNTVRRGSVSPSSLRFSHLNTVQTQTHAYRLKRPAVPSATLMSSFILLCTNVNLCQPPSPSSSPLVALNTFTNSPPCLFLLFCICLLPHSFLHPCIYTHSLLWIHSPLLHYFLQLTVSSSPPPPIPCPA